MWVREKSHMERYYVAGALSKGFNAAGLQNRIKMEHKDKGRVTKNVLSPKCEPR
jgi:hypothetical protein